MNASFGDSLQSAMERAGLNAAELAGRTGLTEAAISLLRSGRRNPSFKSMKLLAKALPELAADLGEVRERERSVDAIVLQNLSVLTRGSTLKHKVLLLGGPNTYLPFLQECWRLRIPQTWNERGYDWPKDRPVEETIFVPENAQYYAAFGACVYGLKEAAAVGLYIGKAGLIEYMTNGRKARLGESAGPPLVKLSLIHIS